MLKKLLNSLIDINFQFISIPEVMFLSKSIYTSCIFGKQELDLFNWLLSVAPCFPVKANQVKIITKPADFYTTLIEKCSTAQKRIVLSSLYLGTGSLEKTLISTIKERLDNSIGLKLNILLDYQRGSRGNINSKTMLLPLLENHSSNCKISLYHTPHLRGFYKKWIPQRWNELIELQHMKVYLIDDSVIISGANLSNDYFTNRQDRYVLIEDKNLADFYEKLVSRVQSFSLQLCYDGKVQLNEECPNPYEDAKENFIQYAQQKIKDLYDVTILSQNYKGQSYISSSDTWVLPFVQAGKLNIQMDSEITSHLFRTAPSSSTIRIATGYFNLTQEYIQALTSSCQAKCSLLMAHPNANGFMGAKGLAGGVPDAYSLLAKKFYKFTETHKQQERITLYEFERKSWTYHGKGLWYYISGHSLPSLTFIGSPNFGERSVNRDIETQIAIITVNHELQTNLHQEYQELHKYAKESINELFERKIPLWVKFMVAFFRTFF